MNQIFNQYSFLFLSMGLGAALVFSVWRVWRPRTAARVFTLGLYSVAVVTVLLMVRFPAGNAPKDTLQAVEDTLTDGRPTFVMLYSHFCLNCIRALPAVRQIDDQLMAEGVEIDELLLDIHSDVGREARDLFAFEYTPTYILYDGQGSELLRGYSAFTLEEMRAVLGRSAGLTETRP